MLMNCVSGENSKWQMSYKFCYLSNQNKGCVLLLLVFVIDHGQTKPKPKPRGAKKLQKLTAVEQEGESKCLFRASNGKKKLSTVVSEIISVGLDYQILINPRFSTVAIFKRM